VYFYVTPSDAKYNQSRPNATDLNSTDEWRTKAGCVRAEIEKLKDIGEAGIPKKVYKSKLVDIPTYTSPLSIVEK
jgi:hypothetical protein